MKEPKQGQTYLPCTLDQWNVLLNEMTEGVNKIVSPRSLTPEYVSQVLMQAIHAYDHKMGIVYKEELLESCINRISCHVSFSIVEDISKKLRAEAEKNKQDPSLTIVDDEEE